MLSDLDAWEGKLKVVETAHKRAATLVAENQLPAEISARVAQLQERWRREKDALQLARELDNLVVKTFSMEGVTQNSFRPETEYLRIFAGAGLDVVKGDTNTLAAAIKKSPARYALVAALDTWAAWMCGSGRKSSWRFPGRLTRMTGATASAIPVSGSIRMPWRNWPRKRIWRINRPARSGCWQSFSKNTGENLLSLYRNACDTIPTILDYFLFWDMKHCTLEKVQGGIMRRWPFAPK